MSHPLFDANAPKQQTQVELPAARTGSASNSTPFSYRQARRYGQNNRFSWPAPAAMILFSPPPPAAPEPEPEPEPEETSDPFGGF